MRYHNLYLRRVGTAVGQERVSVDAAIAAGRYRPDHADRTGQLSIAAAPGWTGPQLAAQAGRLAVAGETEDVALHLHATIHDPGIDFWSANSYIARELGLHGAMTLGVNAMSNSLVAGLELAGSVLSAWSGTANALLTVGDVFAEPRFDPWSADLGLCYGDAGSAVVLGPATDGAGLAELVSTASESDPELEGLNRGDEAFYANTVHRPPVELGPRKHAWLRNHGGPPEADRRNGVCVTGTVKTALYEAGLDLTDITWVLAPHYGRELLQRHVLDPLDLSRECTAADLGATLGHLGASDHLVALEHLQTHHKLRPGQYVLLVGIGVGMTYTSAVLRIGETT